MSKEQRDALDQMIRQPSQASDLAEQRVGFDRLMRSTPLADDVKTTHSTLGGVPVVNVDLIGVDAEDVILYLHGGAYVMGSAESFAGLASGLGRRAGSRVVNVDYRLAPENPYPAAVEDAVAAYRGLLDSGVPASRIGIAGDSAGGGLALATLVKLKSEGLPQPSSAVLLSPWTDLTLSGASMTSKAAAEPVLSQEGLRGRAADYVGAGDTTDPLVSPVFADLTGLPPLLIQVGSNEILLDDATRLATAAAAADVAVTLEVTPEVPHVFQIFAAILEEGDAALTRAGAFLRAHFDA
ncbi:alpha/beta hydrolase [Streptosporangium sp. 'caverna']|uniref:alpha/beta hydrolase n=1 Tax=Streptosporangium sp. 'caverna' TaxID=2202249 RepID=UPI000D7D7217|nr:alpha/beta hydrolase [Streptosporangium sp. 'caverna']AWS48061.1 alpha/beta hydrolase [Streptosporangium sp. 'caverna']